jgi:hypothetical protein
MALAAMLPVAANKRYVVEEADSMCRRNQFQEEVIYGIL